MFFLMVRRIIKPIQKHEKLFYNFIDGSGTIKLLPRHKIQRYEPRRKCELDQPKFKQYKSVTISTATLQTAVEFWEVKENKRKVNPNSVINDIFKSQYEEKKVTDGTVTYDSINFIGKRNDTQKNDKVSEHLVSTGFQSGTLFWTTKK